MAIENKYLNPRDRITDLGPYHSDIKVPILKKNNTTKSLSPANGVGKYEAGHVQAYSIVVRMYCNYCKQYVVTLVQYQTNMIRSQTTYDIICIRNEV